MVNSRSLYSASNQLKMQQNKYQLKKVKAGVIDIVYGVFFLLIFGVVVSHLELRSALEKANIALQTIQPVIKREIVEIPVKVNKDDDRALTLKEFLEKKDSPLAEYAELIVVESDKYGLDWTKIVSIACMESACGKDLKPSSYNAWGIMAWDSKKNRFLRMFNSWEEGIRYEAHLLGTEYKQNENQGIKEKYCPASDGCNPSWAHVVTKTSNEILAWRARE